MNGEELLQVFIFYPYCMELQGKKAIELDGNVNAVMCIIDYFNELLLMNDSKTVKFVFNSYKKHVYTP